MTVQKREECTAAILNEYFSPKSNVSVESHKSNSKIESDYKDRLITDRIVYPNAKHLCALAVNDML